MIKGENIKDLLSRKESGQLEFKEIFCKEEIGKVICSFLNHEGGQLVVGVTDNKKISGISNAGHKKIEIEQYLLEEIIPEAPIMVSAEISGNKELLLVKVYAGSKKPYLFKGSIYYRKGNSSVQASTKEISALIHDRQKSDEHWERQPVLGFEFKDLDTDEIINTISAAEKDNKLISNFKAPLDFLSYYGLYQNGCFTNSAVILFAKEPARYISQARIRVSFLRDDKIGTEFYDDKILEGNLFKNIDYIQLFFKKHLTSVRSFKQNDWVRKDDYIFPLDALREGTLNALIHRDYSNISGTTSILIYPHKVEITNFGQLHYKPSELLKSHLSVPVNPDIAQIVFLRGYIDKIGRGTIKIIDACKKAKLKSPVWSTDSNSVKLTFTSPTKIEGVTGGVIEGVTESSSEGVIEGVIEGVTEGISEGVKTKFKSLLMAIAANEGKRIPFLADEISESIKSVERYIRQLREFGLIEYKGSSKTGGYSLTNKLKQKIK